MLVSITCKYGARQGVIFQLRPNTHQRHPATVALPTSQCAHSCVPLRVRVKSTSLNLRFSDRIGFASGERKNGPRFSPPEKMLQSCVVACRRPLSLVRFACVNHGIAAILRIFEAISRNFSVLQTVWRRGVDSNFRHPFDKLSLDIP
jgi:hypothetical protein